jgi:hypothetical protein
VAIRCPYCNKRMNSVKAVYGHWASCLRYKAFIKKNGKNARVPFVWTGYTKRRPKGWVNRKAVQKPTIKPEEKKIEVKVRRSG